MAKAAKTEGAAAIADNAADQAQAEQAGAGMTELAAELVDGGVIDAPAAPAAPRLARARVLAFCELGAPNDVIEIEADLVEALGDVIDTDPAAVAYAESLKA